MTTPIIDRPLFSLISEGIGPESVSLYISCTEGASDLEKIRQLEKNKELSIDESKSAQAELQEIYVLFTDQINDLKKEKEAEVLEV